MKDITAYEIHDMVYPLASKVAWLNNGGCGIFAAALCRELQLHGVPAKIVALDNPYPSATHVKHFKTFVRDLQHNINQGKDANDTVEYIHNHYAVKIGPYLLDAIQCDIPNKEKKGASYTIVQETILYIHGELTVEQLDYLNVATWPWNSRFNRKDKPKVEKYINKQINKLFK